MQWNVGQPGDWVRLLKSKNRRAWLRLIPVLLMTVGAVLLLYVGSQYASMYMEQRRLVHDWEQQQLPGAQHASSSTIPNDGLTRLSIPKINLNAVIVEGTSHRALLLGPGHVKDTAVPGQSGNSVITGHRDTFFRHIYELNKGDIVSVQRDGKTYKYQVTGKKVVDPSDVSVLRPSQEHRLTLITCYPTYFIGPAPERLVVFSKLADEQDAGASQTSQVATPAAEGASTTK
jgi:LPXTG-site transpeptidase (sortase) family protein